MKLRILFIISFILFLSKVAIAGVPIPWGAKLLREDVVTTGNGEERNITAYETKASKEELCNYYLQKMPDQGYRLFMNGEQNLIFNKGEDLVLIVIPPSVGGKTQFMIGTSSAKAIFNKTNGYDGVVKCEPLPSIPVYPGARCMQSMHQKSGRAMSVSYSTNDSLNTVLNFYRTQMPQYAWRLEKESRLGDLMSGALQGPGQVTMTPEQQEFMRDFYGGATGLVFSNDRGNGCYMQLMDSPVNKGLTLINIVYEEKRSKQ